MDGRRSAPVIRDRIYLTRPDARTGRPWRVASLGTLPFVASGASDIAYDPVTLGHDDVDMATCHRLIGASGALTGYHWGLTRKQAILGWEAGQAFGTAA